MPSKPAAKKPAAKKSSNPIPRPDALSDRLSRTMRSLNSDAIEARRMRPDPLGSISQKKFKTVAEYQRARQQALEARLAYVRKVADTAGPQSALAKKILARFESLVPKLKK